MDCCNMPSSFTNIAELDFEVKSLAKLPLCIKRRDPTDLTTLATNSTRLGCEHAVPEGCSCVPYLS